jgi:adenylosuccinate synthase
MFPECTGAREFDALRSDAKEFVGKIEKCSGVPVVLIGTGPDALDIIDLRR